MLDPRLDIENLIYDIRAKLMELEKKVYEIPHTELPDAYEFMFHAPTQGDYMHPATPTHEKPEGFGDEAYWDEVCQCWMEPTPYEWDEHNYCCNADTHSNYENGEWMYTEHDDWSNTWLDDHGWNDMPVDMPVEEVLVDETANVMPQHDEVHYEEAPVEVAPAMEPAPEMPADMPADMPAEDPNAGNPEG
tara:strand:- start:4886 stop:5455 length:570 start_codon:yes stop_codon:yes gene_type:complete